MSGGPQQQPPGGAGSPGRNVPCAHARQACTCWLGPGCASSPRAGHTHTARRAPAGCGRLLGNTGVVAVGGSIPNAGRVSSRVHGRRSKSAEGRRGKGGRGSPTLPLRPHSQQGSPAAHQPDPSSRRSSSSNRVVGHVSSPKGAGKLRPTAAGAERVRGRLARLLHARQARRWRAETAVPSLPREAGRAAKRGAGTSGPRVKSKLAKSAKEEREFAVRGCCGKATLSPKASAGSRTRLGKGLGGGHSREGMESNCICFRGSELGSRRQMDVLNLNLSADSVCS